MIDIVDLIYMYGLQVNHTYYLQLYDKKQRSVFRADMTYYKDQEGLAINAQFYRKLSGTHSFCLYTNKHVKIPFPIDRYAVTFIVSNINTRLGLICRKSENAQPMIISKVYKNCVIPVQKYFDKTEYIDCIDSKDD